MSHTTTASGSKLGLPPISTTRPPSYSNFDDARSEALPSYASTSQSDVDFLVASGYPRRKAEKALSLYPDLSTATAYLEHEKHWSWRARLFRGPEDNCGFCTELERKVVQSELREYEDRRNKGRQRSAWRKENVYPKFEAATEVVAGTFAVPFYLVHRAKERRLERKAEPDEWDSDDY